MLTAVNASVACYRKAPNSRQFFESHADSGDVVFYVHQDGADPDNVLDTEAEWLVDCVMCLLQRMPTALGGEGLLLQGRSGCWIPAERCLGL